MSAKNFFEQWIKPDMTKSIPGVANMPFDMKTVMDSGRKTFQALTEAQQLAVESMQTIAQRQAEIMSQIVQDQSQIAREIINEGTPEEKIARGAELVRRAYEKTVSGMREVNDMMNKSNREATDIINKRVACALSELGNSAEESATKPQKKEDNKKEAKKDSGKKVA